MNRLRRLTITPPADGAARYPFSVPAVRENFDAQSHGESFLSLFRNRFVPDGLYLLDEVEHVRVTRDFLRAPERFLRHL